MSVALQAGGAQGLVIVTAPFVLFASLVELDNIVQGEFVATHQHQLQPLVVIAAVLEFIVPGANSGNATGAMNMFWTPVMDLAVLV